MKIRIRVGGRRNPSSYTWSRQRPDSATIPRSRSVRQKKSILDSIRYGFRWVFTRAGVIALVGVIIYWGVLVDPRPKVTVGGHDLYRSDADYAKVANANINRLRDSTKLTFDSNRINNSIESIFPEVESSTVELPFVGRQPVVRINISAPALTLINNRGVAYVISASGKVIGPAKELNSINGLTTLKDLTGLPLNPGDQILGSSQIEFIKVITGQSSKASLKVSYLMLTSTPQEIDLYFSDRPYFVKFLMTSDPVGQSGTMLATLRYLKAKHLVPSQYIDVRVSGKVFYK